MRLWSIDSEESFWLFELIRHPIDFWFKSVWWNRFFTKPTHVIEKERNIKIPSTDKMFMQIAKEAQAKKVF